MGLNPLFRLLHFPRLFWIPALLVFGLFLAGVSNPGGLASGIQAVNDKLYNYFGSFYLWFTFLNLIVFLVIGVSPLGKIRLGGPEARPEHTLFSWFAMLFCAGMGTGLMFWGAAEPLYHYMNPPITNAVSLSERETLAFQYSFFHWGLHPWAIYGMTALAIAYFGFNRRKGFHFSSFFLKPHHQHPTHHLLKDSVDLFTILAIIFGIAATFGMGILQLEGGLSSLFNVAPSPQLAIGLIVGMTALFLLSAMSGVTRGIKAISNLSFWFYGILLVSLVLLSPRLDSAAVVQTYIPGLLDRIADMSLGWGNYTNRQWVGEWTVKYWSWWIAWAPFVGMFIAFISKGRTVRELVYATMIFPTLFTWIWFAIMGQSAIYTQQAGGFSGTSIDLNQANQILFHLIQYLTHNPLLSLLCLVIIALNFINSADSATYTIACLTSRDLERRPSTRLRLAWGVLFAALTALFLFTGGIILLQQVTLITALPFSFLLVVIFIAVCVSMIRNFRKETATKAPTHTAEQPHEKPLLTGTPS